MKVKNKRVGDIYLNSIMGDLWILNKQWCDEKKEEIWILNLVHDDCQEELIYVKDFIKVGNIYDMVEEKILLEQEKCN